MRKPVFVALILFAAGCTLSPRTRFWYHPQRTLEQAKQGIERCYDEAFLAEQGGCYSPGSAQDTRQRLMYVEISARQCMKQAGYSRVSEKELHPAFSRQRTIVHGVTCFIAGQ